MASGPANSARTSEAEVLRDLLEGRPPRTPEDFSGLLPAFTALVKHGRLDPNDDSTAWAPTEAESEARKNWARSNVLGEVTPAQRAEREQNKLNNARQLREAREEAEKAARLFVRANLYAGRNRPERERATQLVCLVPRPRSGLSAPRRARGCGPRRPRRCSASSSRDSSGEPGPGEAGLARTAKVGLGVAAAAEQSADSRSTKARSRPQKPPLDRRCEVCNAAERLPGKSERGPCREFAELRAEVERSGRDPFDQRRR
jgi:hypothetical protein